MADEVHNAGLHKREHGGHRYWKAFLAATTASATARFFNWFATLVAAVGQDTERDVARLVADEALVANLDPGGVPRRLKGSRVQWQNPGAPGMAGSAPLSSRLW